MRKGLFAVLALALGLGACSDDPSGPDQSLVGSYTVTQTGSATASGLGTLFSVACTGTLDITSQNGGNFSAQMSLDESGTCPGADTSFSGTISGNQVTILADPAESVGEIPPECTVINLDENLSGTFDGNRIEVDAEGSADCQTEIGVVRIQVQLDLIAIRV